MKEEIDVFVYMMAAEKTVAMMQTIENTLEFFKEYKVKPDEEVKKALTMVINQMKVWVESK